MTFAVDDNRLGEIVSVDLVENGNEIPVTEENKNTYTEFG